MQVLAWEVSADCYTRLPRIVSLLILTITYRQTVPSHRVGSATIQHIACTGSWSWQTSVVGVMKMGNIVPRARIKHTSLAIWASVLTITPHRLPYVITIPMTTCLRSSLPERSVQPTTVVTRRWHRSRVRFLLSRPHPFQLWRNQPKTTLFC